MKIVLASGSPRRKEIFEREGLEFVVVKSGYSEKSVFSPEKTAEDNAIGKARDVFSRLSDENAVVVGSDTVVFSDGKIIGKPRDEKDAESTLLSLSGKTHGVVSAYAVVCRGGVFSGYDVTRVTFKTFSPEYVKDYIKRCSPLDKAGSYGIQDENGPVEKYDGSYDCVVGFPTEKAMPVIRRIVSENDCKDKR